MNFNKFNAIKTRRFKHRGMCRSFNDGKQLIHCCHCCASEGVTCSSQPAFRLHKSCKISLPPRITGDTKPNGSIRLESVDNMPMQVNGPCGRSTVNVKASFSNFITYKEASPPLSLLKSAPKWKWHIQIRGSTSKQCRYL